MPLLNIDGRQVIESGAFVLRSGDSQAELKFGSLKFFIKIDKQLPPDGKAVATAFTGGGQLTIPAVETAQVVFWSGTLEEAGEGYNISIFARGLNNSGIHAHSFEYVVTTPV